ncbi:MAG TPA: PqqD family protein [Kofleriaceae bacterium]|nr:PqqD family protein [Kofleriaceae bacterium]
MSSADALSGSAVPERARSMAWQTIDGETVLLDIDGRELMGINDSAARIWALCDGTHTVDEIARAVAAEFAVDPAVAAADTRAFIDTLAKRGALTLSGA